MDSKSTRFLRRGGQPAPPQSGSRAPRLKDDLSSPAWRKSGNSSQYKRLIYPKWELQPINSYAWRAAIRAFEFYIRNIDARDSRTVRVVVTDRHDCILREWKIGQGVTFPRSRVGRRRSWTT